MGRGGWGVLFCDRWWGRWGRWGRAAAGRRGSRADGDFDPRAPLADHFAVALPDAPPAPFLRGGGQGVGVGVVWVRLGGEEGGAGGAVEFPLASNRPARSKRNWTNDRRGTFPQQLGLAMRAGAARLGSSGPAPRQAGWTGGDNRAGSRPKCYPIALRGVNIFPKV